MLPFSKRQRTLGPGGPVGPTAKHQTQLWRPPLAASLIIFGCHAGSSPIPSRCPSCCHTIPQDLVAQVCVIPESCWNAGLDQSKSQRPHRVSQPGRKASSWEKHKAPFRIQSLMHVISHSRHVHWVHCVCPWGHFSDRTEKLPVSHGADLLAGGGRGHRKPTNQQQTIRE